jgi:hypothetical protein
LRLAAFASIPKPLRPLAGSGARSSAGEHYVDIVGVTGSIPVAPTIKIKDLKQGPAKRFSTGKHGGSKRRKIRAIGAPRSGRRLVSIILLPGRRAATSRGRRQHDPARKVSIDRGGDGRHSAGRGVALATDARRCPCGRQAMGEGPAQPQPAAVAKPFARVSHDGGAVVTAAARLVWGPVQFGFVASEGRLSPRHKSKSLTMPKNAVIQKKREPL